MNVEWFDSPKRDPPVIQAHDPAWAARAADWIQQISRALGPLEAHIEHVGSTAIPGLAAKPVIDIQVAVPTLEDEVAYRPALEGLGLILRTRAPDHRFFRRPPTAHASSMSMSASTALNGRTSTCCSATS